MIKNLSFLFFLLVITSSLTVSGQNDSLVGVNKMRTLVKDQNLSEAKAYLESQIKQFKESNQPDSLARYVEFVGSYSLNNQNWEQALSNTESYVNDLLNYKSPRVSKFAYKELAWIQDESGRPDLAYTSMEKALLFAKQDPENKSPTVDDMYYNMGYYASGMGNYTLAKKNYLKSLESFLSSKNKDYVSLQQVYNSLGGIMWREAKMDSCNYYFAQSLKALEKTEPSLMNQYFRPGLILMNMAVVSNALGKNNEAISFSERAITNFQNYIEEEPNEQQQNAARANLFAATDNLGSFYNSVGAFHKAESLIAYSYDQKKKNKDANDPNVIISEIILAQAKLNTQKLDEARELLNTALEKIEQNPGVQDFWKASALTTLGNVLKGLNQNEEAAIAFEDGLQMFLVATGGNYNLEILTELSALAILYAQTGQRTKALQRAEELLKEITNGQFNGTARSLQFLLAVAETYYQLDEFEEAKRISEQVIQKIESEQNSTNKTTDAVLKSFYLPRATLLFTKSNHQLIEDKNERFLKTSVLQIESALQTIQLRQNILQNYEEVSLLISENKELINFAKQLQLELYQKTKDPQYLEKLITYHESSIYNRIRARLNVKEIQAFGTVPKQFIEQETSLKNKLSKSLQDNSQEGITKFIEASREWEDFIESLKQQYPKYFQLKYSSLLQENTEWRSKIPAETTLVRYLFIEESLYALIINSDTTKLVELNLNTSLENLIEEQFIIANTPKTDTYKKLYDLLWKPLAQDITTQKVIILPDGMLYNLSFETLTSETLSDFQKFSTKSLLAKHTIAYHFSLYLLGSDQTTSEKENFIAFAPSFEQSMKDTYVAAIKDSAQVDKSYLTLLPQPFIKEATQKYGRIFNGDVFVNEQASKSLFLNRANEHKIIHIGTHAESNNLSPELSRLIFAKSLESDSISGNSLYAYEIYNHSFNADLAILTACETGKPTYQPGEGMISLTHAFTYAGSKSILTSLWNVDEQSSTEIVSFFYENLKEGQPKDEALKNAKIAYLNTAKGRTLSPQYWAGIVLIGDTNSLELSNANHWIWISLISILCLLTIAVFFFRKKSS